MTPTQSMFLAAMIFIAPHVGIKRATGIGGILMGFGIIFWIIELAMGYRP